jgi:hypothetical protein
MPCTSLSNLLPSLLGEKVAAVWGIKAPLNLSVCLAAAAVAAAGNQLDLDGNFFR